MDIGIITITAGTNYGNRLQIYAVQYVLKSMGYNSYLIIDKTFQHGFIYYAKKCIKLIIGFPGAREQYRREKTFKSFDLKYLKIGKRCFDENYDKSNIAQYYDAFICGSDQVWNPYYTFLSGGCFADFPGAKKRISYAASFAESSIPEEKVQDYQYWLNGMDAISVREESGKKIVEALTGRDAEVLIDPTMMLDATEWVKIEEVPRIKIGKKYIFKYFLGEVNPKVSDFISWLVKENDFEVVDVLPNMKEENFFLSPSNFVYLLHHAEIVITDSFHASVFAILFGRPLRVFDRMSTRFDMSSRLDTLLRLFGCENLRNNYSISYEKNLSYNTDILKNEREKAIAFLRTALNDNN